MELNKELINEIDKLLTKMFDGGTAPIHEYGADNKAKLREKSKQICKALNLIRVQSNSNYELDEKGILVIQDGGIENYLNNLRLDRDLEKTVKDLTKKSLENEFKNNLKYVLTGGLIGLITAVLTVITTEIMQSGKKEMEEILYKQSYDMSVEQNNHTIELRQMRSEIISLQRQVDSLKHASDLNN
ncbi:hypothetical protein WJN01_15395 [Flavobacteriaceae bacterium SZ-1-7]|uniref:hypothetical protein n=1 Tax=Tamlana sedimenti TaxID=3134126 RepID=UPI0031275C48